MVLREAGLGAERLLEDRAGEPLGERDQRAPARVAVGARAGDDRRALAASEQRGQRRDRHRVGGRERSRRRGPRISCGSGAGADQSSIGTITSAGPRCVSAAW